MLKLTTQTITAMTAVAILAGSLASTAAPASAAPMIAGPALNAAGSGMSEADTKVMKVKHRRHRRHGHRHRRHRHWHGGVVIYDPYYDWGGYRTCRFIKYKKWSPRRHRYVWRTKKRCFYPAY